MVFLLVFVGLPMGQCVCTVAIMGVVVYCAVKMGKQVFQLGYCDSITIFYSVSFSYPLLEHL